MTKDDLERIRKMACQGLALPATTLVWMIDEIDVCWREKAEMREQIDVLRAENHRLKESGVGRDHT